MQVNHREMSWKPFLGILLCASWAQASDEYERMRQLGHNAKFGPNLLTRSKFNRQVEDTAIREVFTFICCN
jgi:hypothetical protein